MDEDLIQANGSYRKLKTFQIARLIYDLTVRFSNKFIEKYSRTKDQMVQAARSSVQNIAEGSKYSATSKKTEMHLTNVARSSLEELLCDYEDFLRQNNLPLWDIKDRRRKAMIKCRFETAHQVIDWIDQLQKKTQLSIKEVAANAIITLVTINCVLLTRQLKAQAKDFENKGGFTERLYRFRKKNQGKKPTDGNGQDMY